MRELPRGTVTFLFTDIEGSTRLLHELGAERYADELAAHRRALREAFARHGGVEVDTQGDAFFVAFPTAPGALAAACEAQEALSIPVRMGLHTGTPLLSEEGYVGTDVHRAARIAAAGHGRQLLVSASTAALLDPSNTVLLDLGEHRLKDIESPMRVFQLGTGQFPPLRTISNSNLPLSSTPLVGREAELAEVLSLLRVDRARILTITGPGGVGKTRFALEVAHELVEDFAHGVWFVDFSSAHEVDLVVPAIAAASGAKGDLASHFADNDLLLVLDNLEHVADAAPILAELVRRCRNLQIVATSREPLHLAAERTYALRPLGEAAAVALLRARAEAADREFDAPPETLAAVAERVDRLPLALELAAARLVALTPETLLARLDERLPLLASRARDAPARQRTLRATIDWSYELLSGSEKRLFGRLSVFEGGWTLASAEAIAGAPLDELESLVDKSMVRRDGERFSMLNTIREFAAAKLTESADAERVHDRFGNFFAQLLEDEWGRLGGSERLAALERLNAEYENVRAALADALEYAQQERGARMARQLHTFWSLSERLTEGGVWLERAVRATEGLAGASRAELLRAAGANAFLRGCSERRRELATEALREFERAGDEAGAARALLMLGRSADALRILRRSGDQVAVAGTLAEMGRSKLAAAKAEEALRLFEEALELVKASGGSPEALSAHTHDVADAALELGDLARARELYLRSARLSQQHGMSRTGLAYCVAGLAAVAARKDERELAARLWHAVEAFEKEADVRLLAENRERYERLLAGIEDDESPPPSLAQALELAASIHSS